MCKDEEFGKKFDKSVFPGTQGGPLEHISAAKAVAFGEALQPDFVNYSQQVIKNAKALASTLIKRVKWNSIFICSNIHFTYEQVSNFTSHIDTS